MVGCTDKYQDFFGISPTHLRSVELIMHVLKGHNAVLKGFNWCSVYQLSALALLGDPRAAAVRFLPEELQYRQLY
jgi:hypothetical protein